MTLLEEATKIAVQLCPKDRKLLIDSLRPKGKCAPPEKHPKWNRTDHLTSSNNWDWDRILADYEELNETLYEMASVKYFHKSQKINRDHLVENVVELEKISIEILNSVIKNGTYWTYPVGKKLGHKVIIHELLTPIAAKAEGGDDTTEWHLKSHFAHPQAGRTKSFTDTHINKNGTLPELPQPSPISDEVANCTRAGLSKRHLKKNGEYNYEQINLDILAQFNEHVDMRAFKKCLMPKALILAPE